MPHRETRPEPTGEAVRGWDGFVAVLATDPQRSPDVLAELKAVVARSTGGVLVVLQNPTLWSGGAVVGVAPRRGPETVGPPLWLGPLGGEPEREALFGWLREGGPGAAPLPQDLLRFALRPRYHAPCAHTTN
ncbi:hypothetical protein ACL02T_30155 [Pseudonocardia sp. RS010]|uniref:hypothetical protein n=1 Tax=Pseudonocardia sp. RS010 TaxID=3385979 RepID=UPI0039A3D83E